MASSIKKGAIISYVAIFLNIAITFFYTPWMIRQIGVSDYGLYSLIMSFISYFIMDFGLHQAVQRFIAKYRAENNEDKVAKMVAITTKCYLAIDAVIFLVLLVLYFFISNIFTGLTPDEIERLKGLYVIAATFSILNFMFKPMAGAMMAFEYFVEERALEMVNKVGIVEYGIFYSVINIYCPTRTFFSTVFIECDISECCTSYFSMEIYSTTIHFFIFIYSNIIFKSYVIKGI